MRVVSWNMAYWKPSAYKSVANRRRQWALLAALAPDVMLLQECRPGDLGELAPGWLSEEYEIFGSIPAGWTACSAVAVRRDHHPTEVVLDGLPDDEARWLAYFSGYLAFADATIDGQRRTLVSVHTVANEVDNEAVTEADHAVAKRTNLNKAWHNDLAAIALRPLASRGSFVIGGDWNTARLFDENYFDKFGSASTEFFGTLRQWGWRESLRAKHLHEVQTYLDPKSAPYQLDHVFTDTELYLEIERASVVALGDDHSVTQELSDHAPVLVDFRSTTPG